MKRHIWEPVLTPLALGPVLKVHPVSLVSVGGEVDEVGENFVAKRTF
jgi:hypothetical protein